AETLVDPETGEIIAEKGTIIDRRTLDRIPPYLEKNVGFKNVRISGGVVDDTEVRIQEVQIYAPDDPNHEQVIKVIGNGYVDQNVKHITVADIVAAINYFFNLLHQVGSTDDIDHL